MLIANWGWWIGDDPFLARDGECLDMDGIDIRTTPRKISADTTSAWVYATNLFTSADTLNAITETIDGAVQSYISNCYINSTWINPLVAWADAHFTVWSNLNDYNATTNPEWVRHFFFTFNNSTNPIKVIGYSGGARAVINTINTSGGASPADIRNSNTSAVVYLWEWAALFARDNLIFELNPSTNVISTGATTPTQNAWARIILEIGARVKDMYYYNGQVVVIYTINNNTKITTFSIITDSWAPNGYYYRDNSYVDIQIWEKCLDSVYNGQFIYWISTGGIWVYNWASQLVKKLTLTSSAKCSYNKWILRIADWANFYEYGVQKPWYGSPLTRKSVVWNITIEGVSETYIITRSPTNQVRLDQFGWAYKASNTWLSHPYTAWQFWVTKKWLGIRIGYTLPRWTYTDSSIQCSITVELQTYDMYAIDINTFVTIATITDNTKTSKEIMFTEIAKILWDAMWSEELGYFRLRLTLNAGDPFSGYWNTLFRKTPEVYDVYITHEEIKQSF